MSKKRKFLIALLSTAVMTAGALGFAACGGESATPNAEYFAAYQLYVQAETDAGRTPDAYQTWLENMLSEAKGESGKSAYEIWKESPAGQASTMTEAEWLESLKGADGTGVAGVELSEDGTKLIITYTDPDMPKTEIDIGSTLHTHTYGNVNILIPCTTTSDGLGYKECSYDGHIELVKLETYKFTLKLPDGSPAAGCTVFFDGEQATTDSNGVVAFVNNGKFGKLPFHVVDTTVGDKTYGLLTEYTTGTQTKYEYELAEYADYVISESGRYLVTIGWDGWGSFVYPNVTQIEFSAYEDKNTHWAVSVDESFGLWYVNSDWGTLDTDKPAGYTHEFNLVAGSSTGVSFSFDEMQYEYEDGAVTYYVNAKKSEGPEAGAVADLPLSLEVGDNSFTLTTEAVGEVRTAYIKLPASWSSDDNSYKFTFGEGVSLAYFGYGELGYNALISGNGGDFVTSGVGFETSAYYDAYFIATTNDPDGKLDIKVENYYKPGSEKNPIQITELGNVANTSATAVSSGNNYFTYECAETGKYVITFINGSGQRYSEDGVHKGWIDNVKNTIELTAGKTYTFLTSLKSEGLYDFTLRKYDAEKDSGYTRTDMREFTVTGGSATMNVEFAATYMYFKTSASEDGAYNVTATDTNGNPIELTVSYFADGSEVDAYHMKGENAYIRVSTGGISNYTLTVTFEALSASNHKFIVKFGDKVFANATVRVGSYQGGYFTKIVEGTTDANGEVTLEFLPCDYEVRVTLSTADSAEYRVVPVSVDFENDSAELEIIAEQITQYAYTLTCDGQPVAGISVSIYYNTLKQYSEGYDKNLVATATTDENGVVTLKAFKSLAEQLGYYVEYGSTAEYYVANGSAFDKDVTEYNITAQEKVIYKVTLTDEEGNILSGVNVSITDSNGTVATATTDESGVATMTTKLVPGAYEIKADGYSIADKTSATDTEVSATAAPMAYTALVNGMTIIVTTQSEAEYYQATKTGNITFTNDYLSLTIEKNGTVMITSEAWMGLTINVKDGDIIRIWSTGNIPANFANVNVTVS